MLLTEVNNESTMVVRRVRDPGLSGAHMSYLYVTALTATNVDGFAEAGATWAQDHYKALGAVTTTASQIIMGGEMAGTILVAFEYETVNGAMNGQQAFYADEALVRLMQDHQVQISRRSLMRVQTEFGERTGEYGSVLYLSTSPIDDASAQTNFAKNWAHMQHGAHGMTVLANVAAGPSPFTHTVVTWADSLDDLLAASAQNMADPEVQQIMAEWNVNLQGRVLSRRLF